MKRGLTFEGGGQTHTPGNHPSNKKTTHNNTSSAELDHFNRIFYIYACLFARIPPKMQLCKMQTPVAARAGLRTVAPTMPLRRGLSLRRNVAAPIEPQIQEQQQRRVEDRGFAVNEVRAWCCVWTDGTPLMGLLSPCRHHTARPRPSGPWPPRCGWGVLVGETPFVELSRAFSSSACLIRHAARANWPS
jgi:hypothetical protein